MPKDYESLTILQKAQAFDLIARGICTGMSTFWQSFDELQGKDHREVLASMSQFAVAEAVAEVLDPVS